LREPCRGKMCLYKQEGGTHFLELKRGMFNGEGERKLKTKDLNKIADTYNEVEEKKTNERGSIKCRGV